MKRQIIKLIFLFLTSVCLFDCKKQVEKEYYEQYQSYDGLTIGKFITYRLDSTVLKSFGTGFDIHTYTVKDSVEAQITDNLNRLSYRVVRYQYDGNQWMPINTFMATPAENDFEFVENNLRIVKMVNPVVDGKTWNG